MAGRNNARIKRRIVIFGGSGFLGVSLARFLKEADYTLTIVARNAPKEKGDWEFVSWDGRSLGPWARSLNGATAVVNLAGRTVDTIKTPDHQDEILRSRVESTRIIGKALKTVQRPPRVWVQMSTAHIYGDPPSVLIDEESAFGYGLAPTVAKAWEEAHRAALPRAMRSVIFRTSFVVGKSGGALKTLGFLARIGLGGKSGHGRQGMSWLHEHDMNRLLLRAIEDKQMKGAYLATTPNPVSNAEFMQELRRAVRMPIGLPATEWMIRFAAPLLLRTDPELALYGRYCVPRRLKEMGFEFVYPELRGALEEIYGP